MHHHSQNNSNRYYNYFPPVSSRSSQIFSTNSTNQNGQFQSYSPRSYTQQQVSHEYQHLNTSSNQNPPSLYNSSHHRHYYQPSLFFQEFPSSSTNKSVNLAEPLSAFDSTKSLEYRQSILASPLSSAYRPPDSSRLSPITTVNLPQTQFSREQLLTDIQRSINDIDRDLTSFERQSSISRYVPSRFSPITKSNIEDDHLVRRTKATLPPVPSITSSVHSSTKERDKNDNPIWPNKPKRIYEVIPSLISNSRQSSVRAEHKPIKINESQPTETLEKNISSLNFELRDKYHDGSEVDETEIFLCGPKNIDTFDEMRETSFHKTLNNDQFLHDLFASSQSHAMLFDSEYSDSNQIESRESTEDLIVKNLADTNSARLLTNTILHDSVLTKDLTVDDTELLIQTASEVRIESELNSRTTSSSTIASHDADTDLINPHNLIILQTIKDSRSSIKTSTTFSITTDDLHRNSSSSQIVTIDSIANNNINDLGLCLFSDFENKENLVPINQTKFIIPTDAEIITDDNTNSTLLEQSQATLSILYSAHVSQQQQQQRLTSTMPSTIEKNNEHVKIEEKEEIKSKKIDATKKPITNTTLILPSSLPSLKQVLPTAIVDGAQRQFTLKNNTSNGDYNRKPSNTTLNIYAVDSGREEQEKRSNNPQPCLHSSLSLAFQMHSRSQSTTSENNDEETRSISSTNHIPLRNIENEDIQTPKRIDSTEQNDNSSAKSSSRSQSTGSNHTNNDEDMTRIDSSAKSSLKNIDRENAISRKSLSRQLSIAPSEQSHSTERSHNSSRASSADQELDQPTILPDDIHKTPTNENEDLPDDQPQTSYDLNQRSPSDRSISQLSGSSLTSSASSALPVPLDLSDFDDNEPPALKIATPKKKSSATHVPSDPSIINGTTHSDMLTSRKSNEDISALEREKPTLSDEVELQPHNDLPPIPTKSEVRVLSTSPSNHKQEEPLHQTPSVSSPTHHKDSINPTSSPSLPAQEQHQKQKDRLASVSSPTDPRKKHRYRTHQNLSTEFEHNGTRSPSNSPHRSRLSDANHNDNTNKNNINDNGHETRKQTLLSLPTEATFATENQRHSSSEKSVSSRDDEHLHQKDAHPDAVSFDYAKHHSSHSSSPSIRSTNNEEELPSMTETQQHSKLSHREQQQQSKGKKSKHNRSPSVSLPQINPPSLTPSDTDDNILEHKSKQRTRRRRVSFSDSPIPSQMEEEQSLSTNWRERVATILASKHQPDEKYAYVQARVNSFDNYEYQPRKHKVTPKNKSHSKELPPQIFGRVVFLPDGSPAIFHEPLEWHASSVLKEYLYENLHHTPRRSESKIFNKKPRWHSESKLSELIKESPRFFQRQALVPVNSLPGIPDDDQPYFHEEQQETTLQHTIPHKTSHDLRPCNAPIFEEEDEWTGETQLKDTAWDNDSKIQTFDKTPQWNGEAKLRTRSPLKIHPSRTTLSNGQIFDEKLNWNARAKVHCWSEIDLRRLAKQKSVFNQFHDSKGNTTVKTRVNAAHYNNPQHSNHTKMISNRPALTQSSALKDHTSENFNYKSYRRNRKSPANKPKWNAVSKTRSVNSVYNPKVTNPNTVRRGLDREGRRKRTHKLPPLKRKRGHEQIPQLPSTAQLAIDYSYDHSSTTQEHTIRNDYAPPSSRRSSKALVPINHHQHLPELELPIETPRSHRPIQQEWYDEMNKSRLTHRTDMDASTTQSFLHSVTPIHPSNTPRELVLYRSTPRNSQNSVMSGTLLDSSIRTNRATELRLSKDMEEHHHHCHTVDQSMPLEIRGFELEGTSCTVPEHATIRPLSNVNYRASERVKNRRLYPWSMLHPHGTSSRNSSLLPIAEFRRTSLDTTITETQRS